MSSPRLLLTINAGSSSIKFAVFAANASLARVLWGSVERIGLAEAELNIHKPPPNNATRHAFQGTNRSSCINTFLAALKAEIGNVPPQIIGHRIVHGGPNYFEPAVISENMLSELEQLGRFAPEHIPPALTLVKELKTCFPDTPQVACFDTGFHASLPTVAKLLPLPRKFSEKGIQRYGFHGLSYSYAMEELIRIQDPAATNGRVIIAHLGNGASLAAIQDGKCIDTTMSLTPAGGLVMSSRSGDLDPGLVSYFCRVEGMSPEQFHRMVNLESGLLGISETSSDVRDLLSREFSDHRAKEALEIFCYQAKKGIGAYAAALGGLNTLVFTGGIGENSSIIRDRICNGLQFLGLVLDPQKNAENAAVISAPNKQGAVTARVIPADEELYIARTSLRSVLSKDKLIS